MALQVPMSKLRLSAADNLPGLLKELNLEPSSTQSKKASPAKAAIWQQGHVLALLYLDTMAALEAAMRCRTVVPGAPGATCC